MNCLKMKLFLKICKYITALALACLASITLVITAIYLYLNPKLPSVDVLRDTKLQIPLRIYSQNGKLLGEFGEKFRTPVTIEQVPAKFTQAIFAAEDDRFLSHQGVDMMGLARAAVELLKSRSIQSGGSTITMQVARNFFLSKEQTFVRKFNEIFLALKIERSLTKNEILELYYNKIYLGKRAYGIGAASAVYYGKSIDELDLSQLAMIAGLPKAPSSYNPITNPERALIRRNWILGRMLKLGFITKEEWEASVNSPVTAKYHGAKLEPDAQYAAEMARAFAASIIGDDIYTGGYNIYTTIDLTQQKSAQKAVMRGLENYSNRHGYRQPLAHADLNNPNNILKTFNSLPRVNNLTPALIKTITELDDNTGNKLTLILQNGSNAELLWVKEQQPIRRFITANKTSAPINSLDEIFKPGDFIHYKESAEGNLTLTQIPSASASFVAIRPFDGAITAVVGGYNFSLSKFNRATQAKRQPGSNFKPFIYAAAFEHGYTAANIINDAPIVFADNKLETDWRPENASGKFYGPTTLRRALYLSRNLVSVRLLREMGIDKAIKYLQHFNLNNPPLPRDLSLALGSYAISPLKMASMYGSIANGGYKVSPYIVHTLTDQKGNIIYQAKPEIACEDCFIMDEETGQLMVLDSQKEAIQTVLAAYQSTSQKQDEEPESVESLVDELEEAESLAEIISESPTIQSIPPLSPVLAERIIDARIAFILDSILKDTIQRGTATKARTLNRKDIAGKTGTTNGPKDAWFSGYHPNLVATAWLGFDNNQLLGRREYGGSAALPIWIDFMKNTLDELPVIEKEPPGGLSAIKIDRITGKFPTYSTQETLFEWFRDEYLPTEENTPTEDNNNLSENLFEEELF